MDIEAVSIANRLKLLNGAQGIEPIGGIEQQTPVQQPGKVSFGDFLAKEFGNVNADGVNAEKAIQSSLRGEELNPHNTVIAVQKASISLTLMMSIKERLERAYQELIRMQLG